jgi:hypothetical protein
MATEDTENTEIPYLITHSVRSASSVAILSVTLF